LERVPDRARALEIARYIAENRQSYILPSLTCSIDREARFEPSPGPKISSRSGVLQLPLTARVIVLDGLHRRAGLETALKRDPSLGDESVAVVF
jgi:DNA sulfur modification protein DndB